MSQSFCLRNTGTIARITFMTPKTLTSKLLCMLVFAPRHSLEFKSTLFLITSLFDCAANRSLAVFQCLFDR
jgi:hypothetical protein